jgi:virginiamycin B lyase
LELGRPDLIRYDPSSGTWREIPLPGRGPRPYAVYVDELDMVWISDFSVNAILLYSPERDAFTTFTLPSRNASVRQMLGRPGELWGAESGADKLVVIRY